MRLNLRLRNMNCVKWPVSIPVELNQIYNLTVSLFLMIFKTQERIFKKKTES